MNKTTTPLDGYKTYIVAAVGIGIGVLLYLRGDLTGGDLLQLVTSMLGLSALRHGVK